MAVETAYAELRITSHVPCLEPCQASLHVDSPLQPPWQRVALWVGWITNVVLGVAVITLGIWVFQLVSEKQQIPQPPDNDGSVSRNISREECGTYLEDFRSQLKDNLCHPNQSSSAGSTRCKLCPVGWQLCGDKCYWVSREVKSWDKSREDCTMRRSQLLAIQDKEELECTKNMTLYSKLFWTGLSMVSQEKNWTWLNGCQLDQTLFSVRAHGEGTNCGAVQGSQIHSEACSSVFQWICQKDAVSF
ncbi:killer cell lectin-like receptor subfamily F member 1 [Carettochelys insculpta]|uniref:killer cell lectin-like receptor subfamily F member 1 n=1 Tax=Carettochelys insculpta TaxID=44489 RepID=UPI003EBF3782